jgi:hypothetical protein
VARNRPEGAGRALNLVPLGASTRWREPPGTGCFDAWGPVLRRLPGHRRRTVSCPKDDQQCRRRREHLNASTHPEHAISASGDRRSCPLPNPCMHPFGRRWAKGIEAGPRFPSLASLGPGSPRPAKLGQDIAARRAASYLHAGAGTGGRDVLAQCVIDEPKPGACSCISLGFVSASSPTQRR